jgi:transposase
VNATTGELVRTARERCRPDDVLAAVEALSVVRPGIPKLLVWDNAPPHKPRRVRDAATAAGITLAFLPFRAPELRPLEDLWRGLKATVAANRCYASLDELTERALAWLDGMTDAERHRLCALQTSKFEWLLTQIELVFLPVGAHEQHGPTSPPPATPNGNLVVEAGYSVRQQRAEPPRPCGRH